MNSKEKIETEKIDIKTDQTDKPYETDKQLTPYKHYIEKYNKFYIVGKYPSQYEEFDDLESCLDSHNAGCRDEIIIAERYINGIYSKENRKVVIPKKHECPNCENKCYTYSFGDDMDRIEFIVENRINKNNGDYGCSICQNGRLT